MEWVLRIMANLLRPDELGPAEAAYKVVAALVAVAPRAVAEDAVGGDERSERSLLARERTAANRVSRLAGSERISIAAADGREDGDLVAVVQRRWRRRRRARRR